MFETKLKISCNLIFIFLLLHCGSREEIRYYPDGSIRSRYNTKTGIYYEYFPNGKLQKTIEAVDGIPGPFTSYYANGGVNAKGTLKDDKLNGAFTGFYPNGFLKIESYYEEGILSGEVKHYYQNGRLKLTGIHENDSLVYFKKYDEVTGEIINLFRAFEVEIEDTIYNKNKFEITIIELGPDSFYKQGNMLHFDFISYNGDTTPYYRAFPISAKVSTIAVENIPLDTKQLLFVMSEADMDSKKIFDTHLSKAVSVK